MDNEFNVLIGPCEDRDKDLFFGPLTEQTKFIVMTERSMAGLLVQLGLFSSKSQAKKAGWDKDIPVGFSDFQMGKKRTRITILNIV